jgi:hypothetical protein
MEKITSITSDHSHLFIAIRDIDWTDGRTVLSYSTNVHARQYFSRTAFTVLLEKFGYEVVAMNAFHLRKTLMDCLPRLVRDRLQKSERCNKTILNLNYRLWLKLGIEPYRVSADADGTQLRILAQKK